ncbi:MAG: undecaprenyldiphospho-muramoylpentapeptide beta-N-acetylglucosaminyltransferase [gamma proteobacterium symbiont of Phacoides pectinatus]
MGGGVMVMAGGTGGHVFPALAVARALRERGREVLWLGTPGSFESRVVPGHGFPMELVNLRGLRGNGIGGWLGAPFMIGYALLRSLAILRRHRPSLVLGMGGVVTGPGGVAARLLGVPLVIHEQNAVPGMTNQWLSRIADRVLEAFPGSFDARRRARLTGNPVRAEIALLPPPEQRLAGRAGPLRLLVLGGSLGAQALNETLPGALARLDVAQRPEVRHQAGRGKERATADAYAAAGVEAQVLPFLSEMDQAYAWADLVVCRAGALTVAELAAAGVASILVPYPHAVDDHQTRNAGYLADQGAARLLPQDQMNAERLEQILRPLLEGREAVRAMARRARDLALPGATAAVVAACEEVIGG